MPPRNAMAAARRLVTLPLLRRESMGNAYHVLTFDDPEGTSAAPGQFAMVRGAEWGDSPLLARPMSYLSAGKTPSILLKVLGEGTLRMGRAEPGEPFSLLGPLGNGWHAPTPARRPILVAGGVGIAPLMFFARELSAQGVRPTVVYGGRTAKDLPLDDELAEIADVHFATEDGSRGRAGLVTDALESVLHANAEVYACGPDRMLARVAEICALHDVPCEASLETPMACGYGVCLGCAVPTREGQYLYACVEGPCVDTRRVDWARDEYAPRRNPARRPA